MSNSIISLGLLGFGSHARTVHLPCISESKECSLLGIASSFSNNFKSNESLSSNFKVYDDYLKLIEDNNIEAVIISTSNNLHGKLTIEALKAGKHVLCEKPLSWSLDEIKEIEQLIKDSRLILCTGFMYRNHPSNIFIKDQIKDYSSLEIISRMHYPELSINNIRSNKDKGGGALLDIACYMIDLLQFYTNNESDKFELQYKYQINHKTNCDLMGELFYSNKNTSFYSSFSQKMPKSQFLNISSEKQCIISDSPFLIPRNKKVIIKKIDLNGKKKDINFEAYNHFQIQLELFLKSIQSNKLLPPLTMGISNAKMLAKLYSKLA